MPIMRKWIKDMLSLPRWGLSLPRSIQCSNRWWFTIKILHHTRWPRQSTNILTLWSRLTRRIRHCKIGIFWKLLTCGLSNMRSDRQNPMNSSSRLNQKYILLWNLVIYTTISICFLVKLLDPNKISFLVTSPSKDTLSLNHTLCQIVLTVPIFLNKQAVDNTGIPLRYHRDDSVVVFWYYQQKYPTLRSRWFVILLRSIFPHQPALCL